MNTQKVSDFVFEKIEEKLLSKEWKPGDKITSEIQLAKELGVSRVSVREAIEKMAALDILIKKKGGGTFVNEFSPAISLNVLMPLICVSEPDYKEILELRMIIEAKEAKLCAERCSNEIIETLKKSYNQLCAVKDDAAQFANEDYNFHMLIAAGSNNSLLVKITEILSSLLKYHQKLLYQNLGPSGGINEHKLILDSIERHDGELAEIYVRRHIQRTLSQLENQQQQP